MKKHNWKHFGPFIDWIVCRDCRLMGKDVPQYTERTDCDLFIARRMAVKLLNNPPIAPKNIRITK